MLRKLAWTLGIFLVAYCAVVVVLYLKQQSLLYPIPQTIRTAPAAAGYPVAEEVELRTRDGETLIAWHVPPREGKPVVLFYHGNGDTLAWRVPRFRRLTADGTGLIAVSFRGYAGSSGFPSEPGLLDDGEAAYRFAADKYPAERIAVWGYSLGTGVAVAVAGRHAVGRLILEAPYTSTVDVAAAQFWFVPVRWLMKDQFRSDQRIANVTAPLLVMHGERDSAIAIGFGERLFELAKGTKQLVRFPQGGHDDLDAHGAVETVHGFLGQTVR
jgi:pimeloyl-ACP methyl ester carboxylesterase